MINLDLSFCSLNVADIDQITQAIREHRLNHLQGLAIPGNHVGEAAVGSLLQALIAAKPEGQFSLDLCDTAQCDEDEHGEDYCEAGGGAIPWYQSSAFSEAVLSDEFTNEWEPKLKDNNIFVEWCSL